MASIVNPELLTREIHNTAIHPSENRRSLWYLIRRYAWQSFWNSPIPHEARTPWWRLLIDKLPHRARLHRWQPDKFPTSECQICQDSVEDDFHLLVADKNGQYGPWHIKSFGLAVSLQHPKVYGPLYCYRTLPFLKVHNINVS